MHKTKDASLPWLMLPARLILFATWQAIVAAVFLATGNPAAWQASSAWWPVTATLTNILIVFTLSRLFQREGGSYRDLFHIQRETLGKDLLVLVGFLVIAGPVAMLPNTISAAWLFGNAQTALDMFVLPLPRWVAVISLVVFPLTVALAELPTYFGYIMPRLKLQTGKGWLALVLCALFLAAQHTTLPLLFDVRFLTWRLVMFIPFAFLIGLMLYWRPRLLPFMMIIHGLMDASIAWMVLAVSLG